MSPFPQQKTILIFLVYFITVYISSLQLHKICFNISFVSLAVSPNMFLSPWLQIIFFTCMNFILCDIYGYEVDVWGLITGSGRNFFFATKFWPALRPRDERPNRASEHSVPSSARVRKERSDNFTPSYVSMELCLIHLLRLLELWFNYAYNTRCWMEIMQLNIITYVELKIMWNISKYIHILKFLGRMEHWALRVKMTAFHWHARFRVNNLTTLYRWRWMYYCSFDKLMSIYWYKRHRRLERLHGHLHHYEKPKC